MASIDDDFVQIPVIPRRQGADHHLRRFIVAIRFFIDVVDVVQYLGFVSGEGVLRLYILSTRLSLDSTALLSWRKPKNVQVKTKTPVHEGAEAWCTSSAHQPQLSCMQQACLQCITYLSARCIPVLCNATNKGIPLVNPIQRNIFWERDLIAWCLMLTEKGPAHSLSNNIPVPTGDTHACLPQRRGPGLATSRWHGPRSGIQNPASRGAAKDCAPC